MAATSITVWDERDQAAKSDGFESHWGRQSSMLGPHTGKRNNADIRSRLNEWFDYESRVNDVAPGKCPFFKRCTLDRVTSCERLRNPARKAR